MGNSSLFLARGRMLDVSLVLGGVVVLLLIVHWWQKSQLSRNATLLAGYVPIIGHLLVINKNRHRWMEFVRTYPSLSSNQVCTHGHTDA